jgi:hypothetical protein
LSSTPPHICAGRNARRADILVRSKLKWREARPPFTSRTAGEARCGQECPRAGGNGAAKRLLPVLAFAASQLGGLAPSRLRIYSVFEHPLPGKI